LTPRCRGRSGARLSALAASRREDAGEEEERGHRRGRSGERPVIVGEEEGRPVIIEKEEAQTVIIGQEEGLRLARVSARGIE
jgi:hypothetical protein